MKALVDCINIESNSEICREEEGKRICIKHDVYNIFCEIIDMDGCVFNKVHGERSCDFLFLLNKNKQEYKFLESNSAWYVELKGGELVSACEQLFNSIDKTMEEIKEFDINALVVSSREFVPKYDNNENYRAVKRLIRKNIQFELTPHTINL